MALQNKIESVKASDLGLTRPESLSRSPVTFATAVRVRLQNGRQGTVACKGRSDVNKTTKKPFKQKGTGRARAGAASSPLWRGGGVTFGPQPRTRQLKISRKASRFALQQLFWQRIDGERVVSLEIAWPDDAPKTAVARQAIRGAGLAGQRLTVFVASHDYRAQASFANIAGVQVLFYDQPNVYDLSTGAYWVFLRQDGELFKNMVGTWS
jgi:large subunit ribosomal protein L4